MGEEIRNAVRARRTGLGLSQTVLATRVGVSRQALSAIEAGRQTPSTTLALVLARALRCSVDDLFSLGQGSFVQAELAGPAEDGCRVLLGRVDGRLVAHPQRNESRAADGVLHGHGVTGEHVSVELTVDRASLESRVLVAGCAPLLGVLAERMCDVGESASWIPANSGQAQELVRRGHVHVAGLHLANDDDPTAHVRVAHRLRGGFTIVNLARWTQGLVVARGNPLRIAEGEELARPSLRHAMREQGSAARKVLSDAIGAGLSVQGCEVPASDHAEVARLVRWGVADVGVAIQAVALREDLGFVPVVQERFDLMVPRARLDVRGVARLLDLVGRPSFVREAAAVPGYDLSHAGEATTIEARVDP